MGVVKQIDIKDRTYYFYNDMINIKSFDPIFLKLGYITIKKIDDCETIHSVNPLYLFVNHANGYIEEKGEQIFNL